MVQVPLTNMEEKDKKLLENCKFSINEIVLCYEPDPMKAKMLYDAKVLDVDITKDDKSRKTYEYYIHFQGWNKSWDRWVLENQVLKANETNRKLQTKLYDEAIKQKKRKPKSSKHESGDENDDKSVTSTGSGISDDIKVSQRPLVSLDIPKVLAGRLEDDCYNIKRKKTLLHLPRKPSVNEIFNEYFIHCEKLMRSAEGRDLNMNIMYEVLQGLNTYFNYYLFTLLLYNFEREQYNAFFSEQVRDGPCDTSHVSPNSFSQCDSPANGVSVAVAVTKLASPNISDSSRSNSRTSSICEDTTSAVSAPLLKEVLKTKSMRKRRGEEKSQSVDESPLLCDCSTVKRSRKSTSSLASPIGSPIRSPQPNLRIDSSGKVSTRERRSARNKNEVYPKEEKAIKPMEILAENIIDMTRTTTRSKRYAPKDSPKDSSKESSKENTKETTRETPRDTRKETPKDKRRETPKDTRKETSKDTRKETPKDTRKDTRRETRRETKEVEDKEKKEKNSAKRQLKVDNESSDDVKTDTCVKKDKEAETKKEGATVKINGCEKDDENIGQEEKLNETSKTDDDANVDTCVKVCKGTENETERTTKERKKYPEEEQLNEDDEITEDVKVDNCLESEKATSKKEDEAENENGDEKKEKNNIEEQLNVNKKIADCTKMEICLENVCPERKKEKPCVTENGEENVEEKNVVECSSKIPDDPHADAGSENGKEEKSFDNSAMCAHESNENRDPNRLRRSIRSVKSTTVSESDEHEILPIGSTAKTLQASYKGPLHISHKIFGRNNKQPSAGNSETFMIFPLLSNGDTPADVYGFEHLLRLFVKLPVLLSSTHIDEPKVVVILKNVRHFLEYLSRRSDLFVDVATIYSESII